MKYDEKESIERLKRTLMFFIENPITDDMKPEDIEERCFQYGRNDCSDFYIIINDLLFRVNGQMVAEDAKYVLNNLDSIQYVYDTMLSHDTVVGDVYEFLKYIGRDDLIDYHYMKAVRETGKPFEKKDIEMKLLRG